MRKYPLMSPRKSSPNKPDSLLLPTKDRLSHYSNKHLRRTLLITAKSICRLTDSQEKEPDGEYSLEISWQRPYSDENKLGLSANIRGNYIRPDDPEAQQSREYDLTVRHAGRLATMSWIELSEHDELGAGMINIDTRVLPNLRFSAFDRRIIRAFSSFWQTEAQKSADSSAPNGDF